MANSNFLMHYVLGWLGEYMSKLYCRRLAHEFPANFLLLLDIQEYGQMISYCLVLRSGNSERYHSTRTSLKLILVIF